VTFEEHLSRFSPAEWLAAVDNLAPEIHPIDLDATRAWLSFFPLDVSAALADARGKWQLADHIDSSHTFLYGHRYWPQTKRAVLAMAADTASPTGLREIITKAADHASRTSSVDRDQLIGIAIVGLMTLRQCGIEKFGSGNGIVQLPMSVEARSIRQVLRRRRLQRSRGLFGILRGRASRFLMTFDENVPSATFDVPPGQSIGASAPPGISLIGVLAGAGLLSPIDPATEGRQLAASGCAQARSADGAPILRLASEARPHGDVTFVTPPWTKTI
jgi:hypothetical protein